MKLRLFAGITAPDSWKRALVELRREIEPRFSERFARWTAENNIHLTLRFFGSVDEAEVPKIFEALQKAALTTEVFAVQPGMIGCFPNASRPRIVWLGLKGETESLVKLESHVRKETAMFGQA